MASRDNLGMGPGRGRQFSYRRCQGGFGRAGAGISRNPGLDFLTGEQQLSGDPAAWNLTVGHELVDLALFHPQQVREFADGQIGGGRNGHRPRGSLSVKIIRKPY